MYVPYIVFILAIVMTICGGKAGGKTGWSVALVGFFICFVFLDRLFGITHIDWPFPI